MRTELIEIKESDTSTAVQFDFGDLGPFADERGVQSRSIPELWRESNNTLVSDAGAPSFMDNYEKCFKDYFLKIYVAAEISSNGIERRFQELKHQWQKETMLLSSINEIAMHPAYQRIIGLGPQAVHLILKELVDRPDHWFWALKVITGADPVEPTQRGRIKEMAQAWIQWGKENGFDY